MIVSLEGYVEFMVTGENQYEVYVSFTDGFFGFERVKYSQSEFQEYQERQSEIKHG